MLAVTTYSIERCKSIKVFGISGELFGQAVGTNSPN